MLWRGYFFHFQIIIQKLGFQVTSFTCKSRKYNSYKGNVGKIAPNRINRRFKTTVPHQKITTDTTELKHYNIDSKGRMTIKKLYFDPFLDMLNSEVLSYSIARTPSVAVMFDIWGCVEFDSFFCVKTGEKHPRFYIKIFSFSKHQKSP